MPLLELYGKKPDGAIDKRVIAGMTGWIIFFPTDAPQMGRWSATGLSCRSRLIPNSTTL